MNADAGQLLAARDLQLRDACRDIRAVAASLAQLDDAGLVLLQSGNVMSLVLRELVPIPDGQGVFPAAMSTSTAGTRSRMCGNR